MKRTWYQSRSDGRYFRNCPLVLADLERPANRLPWRQKELNAEWDRVWRDGVRWADSIPEGDTAIPFDDSKEANDAWVARLLAEHGYGTLTS